MRERDVVRHGSLTISGTKEISQFLEVPVLLSIIEKYQRIYGVTDVEENLVINFSRGNYVPYFIGFWRIAAMIATIVPLLVLLVYLELTPLAWLVSIIIAVLSAQLADFSRVKGVFIHRPYPLKIIIFVNQIRDRHDLIRTIVHEIDHFLWYLEKGELDYSKPYLKRPHEKRARERADEWMMDKHYIL